MTKGQFKATNQQQTTMKDKILKQMNWTGYTFAQLVEMGRIVPDKKTVAEFANAAIGPAKSIEELKERMILCKQIAESFGK
jgi:hypothetical protein